MDKTVKPILAAILCLSLIGLSAETAGAQNVVNVGYQLIYNPWKVAIVNGAFEEATGRKINWRRFESGAQVINAIAAGSVQIALAGSSPIAAAVSRGIDVELFWIAEDIAAAEAMVVRNGSGIAKPDDLRGKTLAVPFASTTHFHTLFALERFGIQPDELTIRDMQPSEIADAWASGEIDATFIWDPVLGAIKRSGRVLITSGELSALGKATFDGLVADRRFAAANPRFMCNFVATMAAADEAYRRDTVAWTPDSPQVQAIVGLIGGNADDVPGVLALYGFPMPAEQVSDRWLGGGEKGGAARALMFTSQFLKDEGKIPTVLPDYSVVINAEWVEMVLSGSC